MTGEQQRLPEQGTGGVVPSSPEHGSALPQAGCEGSEGGQGLPPCYR